MLYCIHVNSVAASARYFSRPPRIELFLLALTPVPSSFVGYLVDDQDASIFPSVIRKYVIFHWFCLWIVKYIIFHWFCLSIVKEIMLVFIGSIYRSWNILYLLPKFFRNYYASFSLILFIDREMYYICCGNFLEIVMPVFIGSISRSWNISLLLRKFFRNCYASFHWFYFSIVKEIMPVFIGFISRSWNMLFLLGKFFRNCYVSFHWFYFSIVKEIMSVFIGSISRSWNILFLLQKFFRNCLEIVPVFIGFIYRSWNISLLLRKLIFFLKIVKPIFLVSISRSWNILFLLWKLTFFKYCYIVSTKFYHAWSLEITEINIF